MRKRIQESKERERGGLYKEEMNGKDQTGIAADTRIKIEMFLLQICNESWLAERNSNRKTTGGNAG